MLRAYLPLVADTVNYGASPWEFSSYPTPYTSHKIKGITGTTPGYYIEGDPTNIRELTGAFTITLWLNRQIPNSSYETYWGATTTGYGWNQIPCALLRNGSNMDEVCFSISNGTSATTTNCKTTVPWDTWTHLACVYKPGNISIYKNGELASSYDTSIVPNVAGVNQFWIGRMRNNVYHSFGLISDFRIYNEALSPLEIKNLQTIFHMDCEVAPVDTIIDQSIFHVPINCANTTLNNPSVLPSGYGRNSYNFNGLTTQTTSSRLSFTHEFLNGVVIDFTTNFTFEVWVRATQTTGYNDDLFFGVWGSNRRMFLGIYNNQWTVGWGSQSSSSTTGVRVDLNWHHFVVVFSGLTYRAYIDGVLKKTVSLSTSFTVPTGSTEGEKLQIGNVLVSNGYGNATACDIAMARIYRCSLTAEEVLEKYNQINFKKDAIRNTMLIEDGFVSINKKHFITSTEFTEGVQTKATDTGFSTGFFEEV